MEITKKFPLFFKIFFATIITTFVLSLLLNSSLNKISKASYDVQVITNQKQNSVALKENIEIAVPKNAIAKPVKISQPKLSVENGSMVNGRDSRAIILENYLRPKGSYLADYTDLIVQLSDQYGVNYKLVVAISGAESGYCKVNFRPFNCWGYGKFSWANPEDGIRNYMEQMYKNYFSKGRTTPETIAAIYNPSSSTYVSKLYLHLNSIK